MTRRLTAAEFSEAMDDLEVEGILAMTGDELRAEILADGGDPDAIAAECRAALQRAIRECEGSTPIAWSLDPVSPRIKVEEAAAGSSLPAVGSFW